MPVAPTYPGVYIEEVPSGVRTLVGVSTSIAAFLGRAAAGRLDEPFEVNGIGEFVREFGPVSREWPMSLAVQDFFQNGGGRALVVRLYKKDGSNEGAAQVPVGSLVLQAAYPGKWGEALRAEVTVFADGKEAETRVRLGIGDTDALFNLTVTDTRTGGRLELHRNLTVVESLRRLDRVLAAESGLVRWKPQAPSTPVTPTKDDVALQEEVLAGKEKDLADAERALAEARRNHPPASPEVEAAENARDAKLTERDAAADELDDLIDDMAASDGLALDADSYVDPANRDSKTGLYALEKADLFNLLCIPPGSRGGTVDKAVYQKALTYCVERRAMLIVDPPAGWPNVPKTTDLDTLSLTGPEARNAALYFPRILQADPGAGGQLVSSVPCGAVAGIMARTDVQRGVWKAPAGTDANLSGVDGLEVNLSDLQNGDLNQIGINCLRSFPVTGRVVWGARTLRGADQLGDEYKYVPVRRLALFLEESLYRGTKWVVFEPNDEPLWAQIRLNVGAFLQNLFRQGAFQGRSPREAYFVKCDKDTTTQNDRNLGIVNVVVGFAPLKPAEFVFIKIQQMAGQIET